MNKTAGRGASGTFGRIEAKCELFASIRPRVLQHGVFDDQRAPTPLRGVFVDYGSGQLDASVLATVSRTAIRTASPLVT